MQLKWAARMRVGREGVSAGGKLSWCVKHRTSASFVYYPVLYDTLIEQSTEKQVLAVASHELGHSKLDHTVKGLALAAAAVDQHVRAVRPDNPPTGAEPRVRIPRAPGRSRLTSAQLWTMAE